MQCLPEEMVLEVELGALVILDLKIKLCASLFLIAFANLPIVPENIRPCGSFLLTPAFMNQ